MKRLLLLISGIIFAAATAGALVFYFHKTAPAPGELPLVEVDYLDVGQGDSILITFSDRKKILIDGGPDEAVLRRLGENMSWNDREIDLMILTHPHDDHVAGLVEVLKRYEVKKVIMTGVAHTAPSYLAFLEEIRERNVPVEIADSAKSLDFSSCRLDFIYPTKRYKNESSDNLNNTSIVNRLSCGRTNFIFMGDAEKEIEDELMKSGFDLGANVLKVGHHGSRSSSQKEFLKKVAPEYAIIFSGRDNEFGHPHQSTIRALSSLGTKIFNTAYDGTIKIFSDGEKVWGGR